MVGIVTILSGGGAHIKKGCNYQFYFVSDFKKRVGPKMKKMCVKKIGVNS